MSMSKASIGVFEIGLRALAALLDKAEAHATAKSIDPGALLRVRLYPDMFDFTRQVQSACDQAKNGSARLASLEPPRHEDNERSFAELKARVAKVLDFLNTVDAKAIDAAADRDIIFPIGPQKAQMKGGDYLNHFVLPNFYFHLTTAYDLLRHAGLDIGKRDFLGAIPAKII